MAEAASASLHHVWQHLSQLLYLVVLHDGLGVGRDDAVPLVQREGGRPLIVLVLDSLVPELAAVGAHLGEQQVSVRRHMPFRTLYE